MHSPAARWLLFVIVVMSLLGCTPQTTPTAIIPATIPAPTVAPIFAVPSAAPIATPLPESSPVPTQAERPSSTMLPPSATPEITEGLTIVPIYSDTLEPDWSLKQSFQMSYDLTQAKYVDDGRYAIEAAPKITTGTLFFTLNKGSPTYWRHDVRGVRFRLTGGSAPIANDALTVAVVGSNAQPYWVSNDTSVKIEGRVTQDLPLFPETRLYYLDINTTIPAGTWVDIVVWLDDLQFEPDYTYVTGFYIKTERDVLPVFYIDQVQLLLDPKPSSD